MVSRALPANIEGKKSTRKNRYSTSSQGDFKGRIRKEKGSRGKG